jgi:hypothetical protein
MDNAMRAVLPGRGLDCGATTHGESRYEHFFAPLNLRSESDLATWIFDRFVLTGPALFFLAYTVGVWLRHQFPVWREVTCQNSCS